MMKIKDIHIENFRCFKTLDLTFEQLTTLVGENGTGKTAILEAINLAMTPSFVASRINEQDFNNMDEGDIEIKVNFDEQFTAKLPDGWSTRDIPCSSVNLRIKRRDRAAPGKALCEGFTVSHYVVPGDSITETSDGWKCKRSNGSEYKFTTRHLSFPVDLDGFPRCFYFDRQRENQSKIGFNSTFQKIVQDYNWRFRKSLEGNKDDFLEKWEVLYNMVIGNVDDKKLKTTLNNMRGKLTSFLGQNYEMIELSILNIEQPFSKSFFSLRDGLNQIDHSRLGAGVSMILTYFLLETISNLAKEELIILVDEPELHLHPQLQNKLREHFKESPSQVILSTHAESMIDIGDWRTVKRFDRNREIHPNQDILSAQPNEKQSTKSIKQHLDDLNKFSQDKTIFFREDNEIFFARACILVEGPVEKSGIRILSNLDNLVLNNLTIVSCNGKTKIRYYQLICKAFGIPYFTLFDKDGQDVVDKKNRSIIDWSYNEHWYGFTESFEHLFNTQNAKHKASSTMTAIGSCKELPEELIEAFGKIKRFESSRGDK